MNLGRPYRGARVHPGSKSIESAVPDSYANVWTRTPLASLAQGFGLSRTNLSFPSANQTPQQRAYTIRTPRVAIAGALDHLFREVGGSRTRWEPRRGCPLVGRHRTAGDLITMRG